MEVAGDPEDGLHGAAEERLLPEPGADPDQQGEENRGDQAQAFRIEERARDLTDLAVEVGLKEGEQVVGGHR